MAVDFKSILRVVFIGLSVIIIASNRVIARPQRGDLEFLPVKNYNCSSMRKDDWSSDKGNRETRFLKLYWDDHMTMFTKSILTVVLLLQVCWAVPTNLQPRITDGVPASRGEFKYQVSIQWGLPPITQYSHSCGGSILNEKYILTAGHCVMKVGKSRVVAGKYELNKVESSQQIVEIARSIVHSGYKGGVAQHDIALLELATPLKLNNLVQPIALPKQGEKQTGQAVLSGWGSISKNSRPSMPNVLQKAVVPILDNNDCYKQLTSESVIGQKPELFDTQVCSGIAGKEVSACSGDSGGPLAQTVNGKSVQVGIVSWGMMPCGSSHMPSVYTRVASYVDWIHSHMK